MHIRLDVKRIRENATPGMIIAHRRVLQFVVLLLRLSHAMDFTGVTDAPHHMNNHWMERIAPEVTIKYPILRLMVFVWMVHAYRFLVHGML